MEFLLEMILTAFVALFFSFLVAKLVSVSVDRNKGEGGNDRSNDQAEETEIGVSDRSVAVDELCSGLKMDAPVVQSQRIPRVVVDENVDDFVVTSDESFTAVLSENVVAEEMMDHGEDKKRDSSEEKVSEEFIVRTVDEAESTVSVLSENAIAEEIMILGQEEGSKRLGLGFDGEVVVAESEEVSVEESKTVEESEHKVIVQAMEEAESTASVLSENMIAEEIMSLGQEEGSKRLGLGFSGEVVVEESEEVSAQESKTVVESEDKMELSIEDDDDWEGIERSELEKAFATASNLLEESGKAEEIGDDAKMELYGLHKIATEGSCRETKPMAIMVSARAKWKLGGTKLFKRCLGKVTNSADLWTRNAWQKLGNMSQEEAMEQYLALVSKEIPGLMNTVGNMQETETSDILHSSSGSLEDPTTLGKTGVAFSKDASS